MPRKKAIEVQDVASIDGELLEKDAAETAEFQKHLSTIESTFDIGMPYDCNLYITLCKGKIADAGRLALEIGYMLIQIKEHEQNSVFLDALADISIAPRTAQRMMQAAVKFTGKKAQLADLGKSKMLELITEDDDDLQELAEGGTIAGLSLDDIDKMSTRELRETLRNEREKFQADAAVNEQMLFKKDEKINQLDKALTAGQSVKIWDERVLEINTAVTVAGGSLLEQVDMLKQLRELIMNAPIGYDDDNIESQSKAMGIEYLNTIETLYADVCELVADARETFEGYAMHLNEVVANAPSPQKSTKETLQ